MIFSTSTSTSILFASVLLLCFCTSETGGKKVPRDKSGGGGRRHRARNTGFPIEGTCDLQVSCSNDNDSDLSLPVRLPIRGPRGPQGLAGEPGIDGENGLPGPPGIPGLTPPMPKKVAFFVGLQDNMGPVTEHTDVKFDRVFTNIGNGYDSNTGHFTAPFNGTYQFNVIVSAQGRQKAAVMIIKNGNMIATVWSESIPYWSTASNVAVLSMDRGDQVWLMLLNRASYLHGYMYTTFSGYMIFEN